MKLDPKPAAPGGVRYALTVPQSVLFADLSLRGNRAAAFRSVFGIHYEPRHIEIDDGAMSWDFSPDEPFLRMLDFERSSVLALSRFVSAMGRTSRALGRVSALLSRPAVRRSGNTSDVLADLREFWRLYELNMTTLFTFWNAEEGLSSMLTAELRKAGRHDELTSGLERFLTPSESNHFAVEDRALRRIRARFIGEDPPLSIDGASPALRSALEVHAEHFGFLLAPFNLGAPASVEDLFLRLMDLPGDDGVASDQLASVAGPDLSDFPLLIQELGHLGQQMAFWKSERLDSMALADWRVGALYREAAAILEVPSDQLFALGRDEIEQSLLAGKPLISPEVREQRMVGFCLVLADGDITFHEPSPPDTRPRGEVAAPGTVLKGVSASGGRAVGKVAMLPPDADSNRVQPGDVLVTSMTRPEMGAALDRAVAFVTDEGGRLSHAAIIAREKSKPCVIATQNATSLLSDGMTVMVDGNAGLVEVLAV